MNPEPPVKAESGLMLLMLGIGFAAVIVKVTAFEVPETELKTVTEALPGLVISLAGIAARSSVSLT